MQQYHIDYTDNQMFLKNSLMTENWNWITMIVT